MLDTQDASTYSFIIFFAIFISSPIILTIYTPASKMLHSLFIMNAAGKNQMSARFKFTLTDQIFSKMLVLHLVEQKIRDAAPPRFIPFFFVFLYRKRFLLRLKDEAFTLKFTQSEIQLFSPIIHFFYPMIDLRFYYNIL